MMLRRIMSIALCALMVASLSVSAFAADVSQDLVYEETYEIPMTLASIATEETKYERGRNVMLAMGYDAELIDSMDKSHVAGYAEATAAMGVTRYYRIHYYLNNEKNTRAASDHLSITVTPEERENLEAVVQPLTKEEFEEISLKISEMQEERETVAQADLIQEEEVFDECMILQAKAAQLSDSTYKISGHYEWTTKPQGFLYKQRTDVFTIAPDLLGRFNNNTMYAIRKVEWAQTRTDVSGVHHMTYGNDEKEYNGANDMTFRDGGFGIDVPIEYSVTGKDGRNYSNYRGYIGGEMTVSPDDVQATLKICVDYAEMTGYINISSISVGIPKSASISFGVDDDDFKVQESALMFHVPDFKKVS